MDGGVGRTERLKLQAMQQVLEVCGSVFRFIENGSLVFKCRCGHGRCGFSSDKREGDGKTPVGTFEIESAFGLEAPSKCQLPFRIIGPDSWWSGEREDYNSWVENQGGKRAMPGSEHLADYPVEYRLGFVIGYNTKAPEWGRGSAIFLHCKGAKKWNTAGCVSLPEGRIRQLMERLRPGAAIKIASSSK